MLTMETCVGAPGIGNKAQGLLKLMALGFNVPPFCVLPYEKKRYWMGGSHQHRTAVLKWVRKTMDYPVMVRSSGALEDGVENSQAGLYLSIGNIRNGRRLASSVQKCWAQAMDMEPGTPLGLIIQKHIQPVISGVCFVYKDEECNTKVNIEAVWGMGEALVQGLATPSHFEWTYFKDGSHRLDKKRIHPGLCLYPAPHKKMRPTQELDLGLGITFRCCYVDTQQDLLYGLVMGTHGLDMPNPSLEVIAKGAYKAFKANGAVDLEWVLDAQGDIHFVQMRPLTRPLCRPGVVGHGIFAKGKTIVAGQCRGVVKSCRSLTDPSDAQGVIVVAPNLTPAEVRQLAWASGVVTTECSQLSHTAIMARELNLPYVAGVDTYSLLRSFEGKQVCLDTFQKTIEVVCD